MQWWLLKPLLVCDSLADTVFAPCETDMGAHTEGARVATVGCIAPLLCTPQASVQSERRTPPDSSKGISNTYTLLKRGISILTPLFIF